MSASSKPPRSFSTKPPSPEHVARVLLDAQTFGDKAAAERHGVHYKTVSNWRLRYLGDPEVERETKRLREEISKRWIEEARDARRVVIARTVYLAKRSKRLDRVTNALRRIHEVVLSHEILNDPDDDQHHGADQSTDSRTAEAPDDTKGGEETSED